MHDRTFPGRTETEPVDSRYQIIFNLRGFNHNEILYICYIHQGWPTSLGPRATSLTVLYRKEPHHEHGLT